MTQISEQTERSVRTSFDTLYRRVAELRWPVFIIVVGAAALHQAILFGLLRLLPQVEASLLQLAVYSATGVLVVWVGLKQLTRAATRQEQAEVELREAYADLERTHRQLQAIHEVGRRVTNASDVQELLGIAARIPVDLLGAQSTTVITFDEERPGGEVDVTWGLDETAVSAIRRRVEKDFAAERCRSCQPLTAHINAECPLLESVMHSQPGQPLDRVVCMPLGRDGQRTGVVSAYLGTLATPSQDEINLASILATEITSALEGAKLRSRQMATLYAVDRATQKRRNLDTLLDRVLETTMSGWGVDAGAILLTQEERDSWHICAHRGLEDNIAGLDFGNVLRLADRAQASQQPLILQERTGETRLSSQALILLQAEGQTLGALFLGSHHPGFFKPAQREMMAAVGSQIALAVRNTQLYAQLRQAAVVEERFRLSREMHDGVAQTLGILGMQAERLERLLSEVDREALAGELKELRQALAGAYLEVREAIDGLRLTVDQPGGFAGALQTQVDDFIQRTGMPVDCSGIESTPDLPPDTALHLLRITQEALSNIRRHAGADHIWLQLSRDNGHLELTIADNGQGFEPARSLDRQHVGLASMRERMRSVNGQLTLASSPGQGTRITARVPLE